MREWDSAIEDQGDLGSCAGNAITNAYEIMLLRQYPDKFTELSRLFVYYNSRLLDDTIDEDAGAYLRDGMKAIQKYGVCSEQLWPYDISKFNVKPTDECYADGLTRTISSYESLQTTDNIINALNLNKPVVLGVTVYDSFNEVTAIDPVVPLPTYYEKNKGGGHAVTIIGYDLPNRKFLIKNSYGTDWGDRGYGWLTFDYVEREKFEAWTFTINLDLPID